MHQRIEIKRKTKEKKKEEEEAEKTAMKPTAAEEITHLNVTVIRTNDDWLFVSGTGRHKKEEIL